MVECSDTRQAPPDRSSAPSHRSAARNSAQAPSLPPEARRQGPSAGRSRPSGRGPAPWAAGRRGSQGPPPVRRPWPAGGRGGVVLALARRALVLQPQRAHALLLAKPRPGDAAAVDAFQRDLVQRGLRQRQHLVGLQRHDVAQRQRQPGDHRVQPAARLFHRGAKVRREARRGGLRLGPARAGQRPLPPPLGRQRQQKLAAPRVAGQRQLARQHAIGLVLQQKASGRGSSRNEA